MDDIKKIKKVAKRVTKSRKEAIKFLKSAGIMTRNVNLSPKYR